MKFDIPSEYMLPDDVAQALQDIYSAIGHTEFVNSSPYARMVFDVNSRRKLLTDIFNELLSLDDGSYASKLKVLRSEFKGHVETNKSYRHYPSSWDGDSLRTAITNIETDRVNALFRFRCASIDTLSSAKAVLVDEMAFVQEVLDFLLSHKLEVFSRLDNNHTIDQHPLVIEWKEYFKNSLARDVRLDYGVEKLPGQKDEISMMLARGQIASRAKTWSQRILREMQVAHQNGWFIVFDSLTLDNRMLKQFYEDKNCLRDYFRNIGREINIAMGKRKSDSYEDCYRYFCTPEYGTLNGRLHFHVVHLCKRLPAGSIDPNYGRFKRNRREVASFKKFWKYGDTSPIAVRYQGDAFTRLGWLWPIDKKGVAIESKPWQAVAFYVTKYATKQGELSTQRYNEVSGWNKTTMQVLGSIPPHNFRVRASRGFGLQMPSMHNLKVETLVELTRLPFELTPYPKVVAKAAKKELTKRFRDCLNLADVIQVRKDATNLLILMRKKLKDSEDKKATFLDVIRSLTQTMKPEDISEDAVYFLRASNCDRQTFETRYKFCGGAK